MDARQRIACSIFAVLCVVLGTGANARTPNFVVTAEDPAFAAEVARVAEIHRRELAIAWLGSELPPWPQPCNLSVRIHRDAFGQTSFAFDGPRGERGIPFGWEMEVNGSPERILDSVLPHEITHTILATYFQQRLPRWLDEGASSTCEHASETGKQEHNLVVFLTEGRGIPFNRMFRMMEYPRDQRDMLALYAQGLSVVRFLLLQGEEQDFLTFSGIGLDSGDWDGAIHRVYGFRDLSDLQVTWNEWVRQGSPNFAQRTDLASTFVPRVRDQASVPNTPSLVAPANALAAAPRSISPETFDNRRSQERMIGPTPVGNTLIAGSIGSQHDGGQSTSLFNNQPLGADLTDSWYYQRVHAAAADQGLTRYRPVSGLPLPAPRVIGPNPPESTVWR